MSEESDPVGHAMENLDDLRPPFTSVPPRRGRGPHAQRGPRDAALSRDEIVSTAIALADAEGTTAINMRHIAKQLGVGTMSLYWHVGSKEHLLDLMVDAVEGENEATKPSGKWQDDLAQLARQERGSLLRHRWKLHFMASKPPLGPNELLRVERSLACLDGLGIDTRIALQMLTTVMTYVTGSVLNELRETHVEHEQAQAGLSKQETEAGIIEWRTRLEQSNLFPRLLRVFDEGIDPDAAETRDERFEFGLGCVLDGMAIRLPA
jgi:AcrR family transcriptional regulator